MPIPLSPETVDNAITSRRSVRGFLPTPIPQAVIETILNVAARAPSGTNIQPWRVYVLTGSAKDSLSAKTLAAYDAERERQKRGEPPLHTGSYSIYPLEWFEPYLGRRRKVGWDMYGLLGIGKQDHERMHQQHGQNFRFFGAPIGMFFTIDRRLEKGSWMDYGMFIQNIMVSAAARGLSTCSQQAWVGFHQIVLEHLKCSPNETLVCGMSIGYEDTHTPINQLRTERAPAKEFTTFLD